LGPYEFRLDDDHYEALVGSIIFQQLAGASARAILNRFKQIYDGKFPRPRQYLDTEEKYLRASGLSPQKIGYIRDLSERIENGVLDLERLSHFPSDAVVKVLDEVKGIGRWTAEMFLIFVLGRTDVLPVDDLGLRKAAQKIYRLRKQPSKEKFEQLSKNWHPYCSIATLYLWRSQEKPQDPVKW
jgi:DNA-3-methyladenine glycosylase II